MVEGLGISHERKLKELARENRSGETEDIWRSRFSVRYLKERNAPDSKIHSL